MHLALTVPALEDKLVQSAAARILTVIYEQDFLPCSFGYRPKLGPLDAVEDITDTLFWEKYTYVVEADIKGFNDNCQYGNHLPSSNFDPEYYAEKQLFQS